MPDVYRNYIGGVSNLTLKSEISSSIFEQIILINSKSLRKTRQNNYKIDRAVTCTQNTPMIGIFP